MKTRPTAIVKKRTVKTSQNTTFKGKLRGNTGKLSALNRPQLLVKLGLEDKVPSNLFNAIKTKTTLRPSSQGKDIITSTPHYMKNRESVFFNSVSSSLPSPINLRPLVSSKSSSSDSSEICRPQQNTLSCGNQSKRNSSVVFVGSEGLKNVSINRSRRKSDKNENSPNKSPKRGNSCDPSASTKKSKIPVRTRSAENESSPNTNHKPETRLSCSKENLSSKRPVTSEDCVNDKTSSKKYLQKCETRSSKSDAMITRSMGNLTENQSASLPKQKNNSKLRANVDCSVPHKDTVRRRPKRKKSKSFQDVRDNIMPAINKDAFVKTVEQSSVAGSSIPKKMKGNAKGSVDESSTKAPTDNQSVRSLSLPGLMEEIQERKAVSVANKASNNKAATHQGSAAPQSASANDECDKLGGSNLIKENLGANLLNLIEEIKLRKENKLQDRAPIETTPELRKNVTLGRLINREELEERKKTWEDLFETFETRSREADCAERADTSCISLNNRRFNAKNPKKLGEGSVELVQFASRSSGSQSPVTLLSPRTKRKSLHNVVGEINIKSRPTVNKEIQTSDIFNQTTVSATASVFRRSSVRAGVKKRSSVKTAASNGSDSERPNIFDSLEQGNEFDVLFLSDANDTAVSLVNKPWRFENDHASHERSDSATLNFIRSEVDLSYGNRGQETDNSKNKNSHEVTMSAPPSRRSLRSTSHLMGKSYSKKKLEGPSLMLQTSCAEVNVLSDSQTGQSNTNEKGEVDNIILKPITEETERTVGKDAGKHMEESLLGITRRSSKHKTRQKNKQNQSPIKGVCETNVDVLETGTDTEQHEFATSITASNKESEVPDKNQTSHSTTEGLVSNADSPNRSQKNNRPSITADRQVSSLNSTKKSSKIETPDETRRSRSNSKKGLAPASEELALDASKSKQNGSFELSKTRLDASSRRSNSRQNRTPDNNAVNEQTNKEPNILTANQMTTEETKVIKKRSGRKAGKTEINMLMSNRHGDVSSIIQSQGGARPQRTRKPVRYHTTIYLDEYNLLQPVKRLKPRSKVNKESSSTSTKTKSQRTKKHKNKLSLEQNLDTAHQSESHPDVDQTVEPTNTRVNVRSKGNKNETPIKAKGLGSGKAQGEKGLRMLDDREEFPLERDFNINPEASATGNEDALPGCDTNVDQSETSKLLTQVAMALPNTSSKARSKVHKAKTSTKAKGRRTKKGQSHRDELPLGGVANESQEASAVGGETTSLQAEEPMPSSIRQEFSREPAAFSEKDVSQNLTDKCSRSLDRSSKFLNGHQLDCSGSFENVQSNFIENRLTSSQSHDDFVRHVIGGNVYNLRYISRIPARSTFIRLGNLNVCETIKDPEGGFSAGFLILQANDMKRPTMGHKYSFIYNVISGSAHVQLENKRGTTNKGEFFYVPRGMTYSITNANSQTDLLLAYVRIKGN